MTIGTIIVILILLALVGGVPAPDFTPQARWIVSAVIIVAAIVWLLRFSGIHV